MRRFTKSNTNEHSSQKKKCYTMERVDFTILKHVFWSKPLATVAITVLWI